MEVKKRSYGFKEETISSKILKYNNKLQTFLQWCKENNISLSKKVKVTVEDVCSNIGMVASEDIHNGEVLATIPRTCLLQITNCSISNILDEDECFASLPQNSWVKLLLSLLYEVQNETSFWHPYLDVFPDYSVLDPTLFWPKDFLETELKATGICEALAQDLEGIEKDFQTFVLPFVKKHHNVFKSADCLDVEYYKKLAMFVMAYSFTEPKHRSGEQSDSSDESDSDDEDTSEAEIPMMVPVADILNHVAKHNARVGWGEHALKITACQNISKGEEIFNTYGELSNSSLLHMYGFAEPYPNNINDMVEISLTKVAEYLQQSSLGKEYVQKRWNILLQHGLEEVESLAWKEEGILSQEETIELLKVMTITEDDELMAYQEDGELSIVTNDEGLATENLPSLPDEWRSILRIIADGAASEYPRTFEEEQELNKKLEKDKTSWRQIFASRVRLGQLSILYRIKTACSK